MAAFMAVTSAASAVEKRITVLANIDPSLEMTQSDGSALPTSITMNYNPVNGIRDSDIYTKLVSNSPNQDITMSLLTPAVLTNNWDPDKTIPLTVTYNDMPVTTTPWPPGQGLKATEAFTDATGISKSMVLRISAPNTDNLTMGTYQGDVSILVQHMTPVSF